MEDIARLQREINSVKGKHSLLLCNLEELEEDKKRSETLIKELQNGIAEQKIKMSENEEELNRKEQEHKETVGIRLQENQKLEAGTEFMKEKIVYLEREAENLKKMCLSGMVKKMVFKGNLSNMSNLSVNHQIKYPISGGSALITFQNSAVAAQIISAKDHTVKVEECSVHVKSEAVALSVLDSLHMEMSLSPTKIFVYDLPPTMTEEVIMDKLELFFGKSKNGGGEVEKREFLTDCRSAILTFLDKEVASGLVAKKYFHVPFGDSVHKVCVAASLEGILHKHEMRNLECNRTVLITGIPDIIDKDTMRDLLEIHFQKPSNGGGEVQELMYCPEGQHTIAVFEDDKDDVPFTE